MPNLDPFMMMAGSPSLEMSPELKDEMDAMAELCLRVGSAPSWKELLAMSPETQKAFWDAAERWELTKIRWLTDAFHAPSQDEPDKSATASQPTTDASLAQILDQGAEMVKSGLGECKSGG